MLGLRHEPQEEWLKIIKEVPSIIQRAVMKKENKDRSEAGEVTSSILFRRSQPKGTGGDRRDENV